MKCQSCSATFDLELTAGQRIIEFAKDHPCPGCKIAPGSVQEAHWHHVIGFHASKRPIDISYDNTMRRIGENGKQYVKSKSP